MEHGFGAHHTPVLTGMLTGNASPDIVRNRARHPDVCLPAGPQARLQNPAGNGEAMALRGFRQDAAAGPRPDASVAGRPDRSRIFHGPDRGVQRQVPAPGADNACAPRRQRSPNRNSASIRQDGSKIRLPWPWITMDTCRNPTTSTYPAVTAREPAQPLALRSPDAALDQIRQSHTDVRVGSPAANG
jgi:hypothetical protein